MGESTREAYTVFNVLNKTAVRESAETELQKPGPRLRLTNKIKRSRQAEEHGYWTEEDVPLYSAV